MTINVRAIATLGIGFGPLAMATLGFLPLLSVELPYQPTAGATYTIETQHASLLRMFAQEPSDTAAIRLEATWDADDAEVLCLWAATLHGA